METEATGPDRTESKRKPFREKLKDVEYRRKFLHTLVLFASFLVLGLCDTIHFPAILDLAEITGTNIEGASVFYTSMSVGGLVGTLGMGFLFDKLPTYRSLLLAGANLGSAITITSIPWSSNYILTIFLFFICYVFNLAFDTGTHADIFSMWGSDGKVFVQFLHFSYSFGSIVSPLIVKPFLGHSHPNNVTCTATIPALDTTFNNTFIGYTVREMNTSYDIENSALNSSTNVSNLLRQECTNFESRIHYAYIIAGVLCFLTALILVAEAYAKCIDTRRIKDNEDDGSRPNFSKQHTIYLLIIISALYVLMTAPGNTIPGYIMPFGVDERGWTKESTAYLASIYWAVFAAARLAAVFAINFMSAAKLLIICFILLTVSMGGLWISVVVDSDAWVWACLIASSGGFSVSFPTGFIYVEKNIMKVSGMVASVMMLVTNGAGIVNPLILGALMEDVSLRWYIYLTLGQVVAAFVVFIVLHVMVTTKIFPIKERDLKSEEAVNCLDKPQNEDAEKVITEGENLMPKGDVPC